MRRFTFASLRMRLILLVLLAVIPAMGLALYSGMEQRKNALSRAQEDALRLAENASDVQERLIENTRQIFFTLSQMREVQQLDAAKCSKVLANLLSQSKGYTNLFAIKPNGDVFASALTMSGHVTFADRAWFKQLLKTREFIIGEYLLGRITGKAALTLAHPVLNKRGQLKAILGTGLDLGWLSQFMTEIKTPAGTSLAVLDRNGTILLRHPGPEKFVGKTMPERAILRAILAKGEGTSEAIGLDGVPRLYGFTSLDRFSGSVYVTVGIPKETAFAAATQNMMRNLTWLGIVAALAIGAAWVAGSLLIMRPVNELLGVTGRLGAGDLIARIGPRYERGELGQLGRAFDQMAESLQKGEAERNAAEDELKRHRDHLEELVQERTVELKGTNERLEKEILERKGAEEALRLANAYNRSLIEASLDPLVTIGSDGRITDVNVATEKVTGHSREELIGTDFMGYFSDPEKAKAGYQKVFQDGFVQDYALEIRAKDGHLTPVLYNASVYRDEAGQVIGVFAAARDITERKRAEEEVRTLNAELENRVVQRTTQLEAANKELEAFSYSVSHDLRAPLRAIDGFSRILLEDYIKNLDEEGKRVLGVIRNNTQKMGQLIDDLLVFSRLGRQEIRVSEINMERLAKTVFEEVKPTQPERKMRLTIRQVPPGQGDPAMIKQVFSNLLSNAIKFTRPKETATIELGGFDQEKENFYYVKDNGVGFDMQYVHKLFGVFQRLHSSEEFEGTGVGLAIVQRIVHRHGGRVWAEGKVNEGATFYFSLPAKK